MSTHPTGRGAITPGQKQFLRDLGQDGHGARELIARAIGEGVLDDMSAQAASSLIGSIQAARSPRPALRKKPA